jgi:flagellin
MMQRQRELAVQSSNDTLTSTERKYLDDEFQELSKEIGRIALSTDYNGKNLLAIGSFGTHSLNPNNSFGAANQKGIAQSYTLQVGPNYSNSPGQAASNQMTVTYAGLYFATAKLNSFSIGGVNFSALSISKTGGSYGTAGAYGAIDSLDAAIKSISGARAKIGTYINRLEYTVNNIASLEFNTQEAESRIRDTNFAQETTNFTKNQIMVQSATSMLAQANTLPQTVLGLLG